MRSRQRRALMPMERIRDDQTRVGDRNVKRRNNMEISLKDLKEIMSCQPETKPQETPWKVGEMWLFRTVTMIQSGRVKAIMGPMVVLEDAAWIADTGRFFDFLNGKEPNEVEPFPNGCVVNTGALVDATCLQRVFVVQK